MPKRDDIQTILVIGSGPIVIGQACEFDYSGAQACQVLERRGLPRRPGELQPRHHHDRPGHGGRAPTWSRITLGVRGAGSSPRSAPTRCCPRWAARPASTRPWSWRSPACSTEYGVEMIGCHLAAIERRRGPRACSTTAWPSVGIETARSGYRPLGGRAPRPSWLTLRLSRGAAPLLHAGRRGRRHRARPRRSLLSIVGQGLEALPAGEVLVEESHRGLEGVSRWRSCATMSATASSCAPSRTSTPMGVHTGDSITVAPGADAHRRGVPAHARHALAGILREDRRGDRRLQRPVRRQPGKRPHDRHRDEPARVAFLGAGVEGHGLPHREGRGEAGRGLHA